MLDVAAGGEKREGLWNGPESYSPPAWFRAGDALRLSQSYKSDNGRAAARAFAAADAAVRALLES